ncbi:hypothetical protein [Kitasatospora cineracea]|uniref:Uncharacterized protein n=1 Tax=Kitasatospora cineracea TaxID=88074 RepID=A0A3N4RUP8_9ACTN|nr:hypothetical protein [Kitasatospora cineracea]RPE34779.1 hypothetical protein EDD38_3115 [Kitasatospora cineracea]
MSANHSTPVPTELRETPLDPGTPMVMVRTPTRLVIGWDPAQIPRDHMPIVAMAMGIEVR